MSCHRLSTHLIRSTARRARKHYSLIQTRALLGTPAASSAARVELRALGLGAHDRIEVERAVHERGKYRVVSYPQTLVKG